MSRIIEAAYGSILKIFGVQVETSPNALRIASNASWLLLDNIIRSGVGFFVGAAIARYLGPAQYGILSYAMAIVSLFTFVGTLGLNEIVVCSIVSDPFRREETLGTSFLLRIFGGSFAFGIALFVVYWLNPLDPIVPWIVGILAAGMVFQAFDVIDWYFQSQVQSKYTVLARIAAFTLFSGVKIGLILYKAPLVAFAWAGFAEAVTAGFGLCIMYQAKKLALEVWKSSFRIALQLLRNSWPMFLSGVAAMIYMRIDQIMLLHMRGEGEAGIYAAAVKISEMWYVIGAIIISSVFPIMVGTKKSGEDLYRKKLLWLYKVLVFIGVGASCLTALLARPVVAVLYGPSFQASATVLAVHVLGVVFVYLGGASTYALVSEGLQKYHVYRTGLGCIANIGLNCLLIPHFGAKGAAAAMLASYSIAVFSVLCFKRTKTIFGGQG